MRSANGLILDDELLERAMQATLSDAQRIGLPGVPSDELGAAMIHLNLIAIWLAETVNERCGSCGHWLIDHVSGECPYTQRGEWS